jgi:hypothetical protein
LKSGTELETEYLVSVFSVLIPFISVWFLVLVNFATKVVCSKKTQTNGGEILKFQWVPFSVWAFSIITPGIPTHYLFFTKENYVILTFIKRSTGESPTYFFIFINKRKYKRDTYTRRERRGREVATTTTATVRAKTTNTRQPCPKEKEV